ncbi:MAG: hypothetical protein Q9191_002445 [Dirinaria sp. TL-2023a]
MEPWQSWALVGAVGAGAYFYYANTSNPTRGRHLKPNEAAQAQRRASNASSESNRRQKKGKKPGSKDRSAGDVADVSSASAATSGNENAKKKKKKTENKRQPSKLGQSSAVEVEPPAEETGVASQPEEEPMDNQEFAKQMAGLKVGSSLARPSTASETKKTRKQGKRNNGATELPPNGKTVEPTGGAGPHETSTTSSTTGADADDDLSPATSPALHGSNSTPDAGGVSDMLEVPARGPSIVRVTPPAEPQPDRQPKQKKAAPEPETKKQRQRRQKNEAAKAARAEAEQQRRELMEKQRRTAREAEGRPAKNGLGSAPPANNVWSTPAGSVESEGNAAAPVSNTNGPLLDTFEEHPKASLSSSVTEANGSTANRKPVVHETPSEEEQMKMLSEVDDDGWNTVVKGGKTKKKSKAPLHSAEAESSTSGVNLGSNGPVNGGTSSERKRPSAINAGGSKVKGPPSPMIGVVPPKPRTTTEPIDPKVWNRSNIHLHPDYDPEYPYALTGHPDDSDWAVV